MKTALVLVALAFGARQAVAIVDCCCAFCAEEGMDQPAAPPDGAC